MGEKYYYRVDLVDKHRSRRDRHIFWIVEVDDLPTLEDFNNKVTKGTVVVTVLWTRFIAGEEGVCEIIDRKQEVLNPRRIYRTSVSRYRYVNL